MDAARRSTYKYNYNADYQRMARSKATEVSRKERRCNVLMANRNIDIKEEGPTPLRSAQAEQRGPKVKRLEKLKEWQFKRDALKQQQKEKTRPFYAGGSLAVAKPAVAIPVVDIFSVKYSRPLTRLQAKNAAKVFTDMHKKQPTAAAAAKRIEVGKSTKQVKKTTRQVKKSAKKTVGTKKQTSNDTTMTDSSGKDTKETSSDDDAWIPASQRPKEPVDSADFDAAFNTLSPFRFGTSNNQSDKNGFGFNFQKKAVFNNYFVTKSRGRNASPMPGPPQSPLHFQYRAADDLMGILPTEGEASNLDTQATVKRNAFCDSTVDGVSDTDNTPPLILLPLLLPSRESDSGNVADHSSGGGGDSDKEDQASNRESENTAAAGTTSDEAPRDTDLMVAVASASSSCTTEVERFETLHEETVACLSDLSSVWGKKAEELSNDVTEEVLGQIRTTACQAQLLVNKKLKQFLGLCRSAKESTGERITTVEDLQGFWDMVSFQIKELKEKFALLQRLELNSWIPLEDQSEKKPKKSRAVAIAKKKKKVPKEATEEQRKRLDEQREKRAAARNQLRELKAAAKKRDASKMVDAEENVATSDKVSSSNSFVSSVAVLEATTPKKKRNEDTEEGGTLYMQVRRSLRRTPSKYRRMSYRSASISEDSDAMVQRNRTLENSNLMFLSASSKLGFDFSQYMTPPSPGDLGLGKLRLGGSTSLSEDSLENQKIH